MLRYYPQTTVLEAQRTTLADFEIMVDAYVLRNLDKKQELYMQAWAMAQVESTTKKGERIYKNFKDFFDYEKELDHIKGFYENKKENKKEINIYKKIAKMNGGE